MKYVDQFFQVLRKGLTGKNRTVFIAAAVLVLGVSQYVYLKYFIYTSPSDINEMLSRLGPPGTPQTIKVQTKLKKWGHCVIDETSSFCLNVENPVQMEKGLRRTSAVEVLTAFSRNPNAFAALIRLTESKDGIVRQKAVFELRYLWGEGATEALLKTIHAGDVQLTVMDGTKPVIYKDFDLTAVESLIAMNKMWMTKDRKAAEKIQKVLEKALEYPRVGDKARKALGR